MTTSLRDPLKPLVKWSGGKRDELDKIKEHIPENYTIYAEPFAGGASLLFHLNPPEDIQCIISDTHPDLIQFYQQIANGKSKELKEKIGTFPCSEEGYYKTRDELNPMDPIEKAAQFYYLRKTCYRGMLRYNSKGKFNIPWGRYKAVQWNELDNPAYGELLARTKIIHGDFGEVFELCQDENAFIFLDPPYDTAFASYGPAGTFTQDDHRRLFDAFSNSLAKCLMIISETPFIKDLYKDYIVDTYDKKYRFRIHSKRVEKEDIDKKHLIIKNY